jgi:hypothetical protein
MKLIGVKFTPCPHCGKWSFVKPASMSDLHAAELNELDTRNIPKSSEEHKLRKEPDDSKYQNL